MPNPEITGFLEPWIWNMNLSFIQYFGTISCIATGQWGLFFYNDGGEMMDRCFKEAGGMVMEYEGSLEE